MPLQTQKHICVIDRPLTRRSCMCVCARVCVACVCACARVCVACVCVCVCVCVWPRIEHSAKHSALSVRNFLLFYYIFYFIKIYYYYM